MPRGRLELLSFGGLDPSVSTAPRAVSVGTVSVESRLDQISAQDAVVRFGGRDRSPPEPGAAQARSYQGSPHLPAGARCAATFQPRSTASPIPVLSPAPKRWVEMGGIAGDEDVSNSSTVHQLHARGPWIGRKYLCRCRYADNTIDDSVRPARSLESSSTPSAISHRVPFKFCSTGGPNERGGLAGDGPILDCRSVSYVPPQFWSLKNHSEVGPQREFPVVGSAH